ncbi:hypothetical protein V2J09_016749 [Rumex salicifolius]
MVGRYGSLSRSLLSAARSSAVNSPRLRPPSVSTPRLHRRHPGPRFPASTTRNWGELGAVYSFLPLVSTSAATSHLPVGARACCELFHGTFRRTCQDR